LNSLQEKTALAVPITFNSQKYQNKEIVIQYKTKLFMPYQYKRGPLSDVEVNRLTNVCDTFDEKFVIWTLLDTTSG
jgi:hypothetical protein